MKGRGRKQDQAQEPAELYCRCGGELWIQDCLSVSQVRHRGPGLYTSALLSRWTQVALGRTWPPVRPLYSWGWSWQHWPLAPVCWAVLQPISKASLEGDLADASPWLQSRTPLQHPPRFSLRTLWSGLLLPACLFSPLQNLTAQAVCQQDIGEGRKKNFRFWKCYLSVSVALGNHN